MFLFLIGTEMHIDPLLTDAFNALISGEKWWVSLPKDLYEFRDEFKCDSLCSDVPNNFHRLIGVWFIHIMPQIRYYTHPSLAELSNQVFRSHPKFNWQRFN